MASQRLSPTSAKTTYWVYDAQGTFLKGCANLATASRWINQQTKAGLDTNGWTLKAYVRTPEPVVAPKAPAYDTRHGGPHDRGSADAYYGRGYRPHYFLGKTYQSPRVAQPEMTEQEIAAYRAGYEGETDRKGSI